MIASQWLVEYLSGLRIFAPSLLKMSSYPLSIISVADIRLKSASDMWIASWHVILRSLIGKGASPIDFVGAPNRYLLFEGLVVRLSSIEISSYLLISSETSQNLGLSSLLLALHLSFFFLSALRYLRH